MRRRARRLTPSAGQLRGPSLIMNTGLFITGTDTGVGKTLAARLIVRSLAAAGIRTAVMKPVAAGCDTTPAGARNEDAVALMAEASVEAPYELVNPYCLAAPVSPHIAAAEAGVNIDLERLAGCCDQLSQRADCVVVEGAGGWLVPISDRQSMADLALRLKLPVVLVVGLRLGCLNHALLTSEAIRSRGARFGGWVANHLDPAFERRQENLDTLSRLLGAPPLADIPHGAGADRGWLLPAAASQRLLAVARESRKMRDR